MADIGTAVVLLPFLRRQTSAHSQLCYGACHRCVFIAVGVLSLLSVVTLRQEAAAGADAASLLTAGKSLVALKDWTRPSSDRLHGRVGNGLPWAT